MTTRPRSRCRRIRATQRKTSASALAIRQYIHAFHRVIGNSDRLLVIADANGAWPGLDGIDVWPIILKGSTADTYEAHHTIAISAEVLLVGEHKLLVGQGHVGDSGPKTRPTPE